MTAIAGATTQPMNVQPRNRLMTATDPALGIPLYPAIIVGIQ
jgi:hypothetical protein